MRCLAAFMVALLSITGPGAGGILAQTTYDVPDAGDLDDVILSASAGDFVRVSNKNGNNDPYDSITMKAGVKVYAKDGHSPKISGSGASYAVTFPTDADTLTILEGFAEITTGSFGCIYARGSGIVRDCLVRSTDTSGIRRGIYAVGPNLIENCTVEIARGAGIRDAGTYCTVQGCTVTVTDSTYYATGIELVALGLVQDCFVTAPGTVGLYADAGQVLRCTVDNARVGYTVRMSNLSQSIASNCWQYGFDGGSAPIHSVSFCIADGPNGFSQGAQGSGSKNEDPLYCDSSNEAYTLRIDSWGNPENNGLSQIGAFPVACAWGELVRSTTVAQDSEILVMKDVAVPDTTSLTLQDGVVFQVDDYDDGNLGDHSTKVELIVENGGTLTVAGRSGNPVQFVSSKATPAKGDWYGICLENSAEGTVDTAVVKHAVYGVLNKSGETTRIAGCTFTDNQTYDVVVGYSGYPDNLNDATVSGNSITVQGVTGIHLETSFVSGTTIQGNTITGSASASYGIDLAVFTGGTTPTIDGNTISGFNNGYGITSLSDATIKNNTISSNKWGIQVTDGTPAIGLTTGGTNQISSNTTGILANGGSADPVVRKNYINSNTYGVTAKSGANPDLGTSTEDGDNNLASNSTYCIWNRNTGGNPQIKAHGNYYGACIGGAPSVCWNGNVDTGTSLCSDPLANDLVLPISLVAEPQGLRVLGAIPNPTSGPGVVHFHLEDGAGNVHVQVFDVAGRLVRDIGLHHAGPGENQVPWDGRDGTGRSVQNGLYFVRVAVEGVNPMSATTKMLVSR